MKKLLIAVSAALLLNSCGTIIEVGQLDVASTNGNEVKKGEVLAEPTYKNKDIRKNSEKSIDLAIDKELAKYPGATHMENVRIYLIDNGNKPKFAVQGKIIKSK